MILCYRRKKKNSLYNNLDQKTRSGFHNSYLKKKKKKDEREGKKDKMEKKKKKNPTLQVKISHF